MTMLAKQEFMGSLSSQILSIYEFIENTRRLHANQRVQCAVEVSGQHSTDDLQELANWLAAREIEVKFFVNHQSTQHLVTLTAAPPKQSFWRKVFGGNPPIKKESGVASEQPQMQSAPKESVNQAQTTQRAAEMPKNETRKPTTKAAIEPDVDSPYPDLERLLLSELSVLVEQASYQNKILRQERQQQIVEIKQIDFHWMNAGEIDYALKRQLVSFLANSELYPVRRAWIRGLLRKINPACIEYFVLDQIELHSVNDFVHKKATIEQIDLAASDERLQPALQVHIDTSTYLQEKDSIKDSPKPTKELTIKIADDSNNRWEYVATSRDFKIGRAGDVTLSVSNSTAPKVSREHIRCFLQNDTWYIQNISLNKKAAPSEKRKGNPILIDGIHVLDTGEKQAIVHDMSVRVGTADAIAVGEYAIYPELIFELTSDLFDIDGTDFNDAQRADPKPNAASDTWKENITHPDVTDLSTDLMIEPTDPPSPDAPINPPICYVHHESAQGLICTPVYQLPLLIGRSPNAASQYIVPAHLTKVSRQHVELRAITEDGVEVSVLEKASHPAYILRKVDDFSQLQPIVQGASTCVDFDRRISLGLPTEQSCFIFWISRHAN